MKQLDELVIQKLIGEPKPEQDDDHDEYAPYRLFTEQEAKNISKLRNKIEAQLDAITEKKLVETFFSTMASKERIQEIYLQQVDPELNKFIFNLETDLEKTIALLALNDMYAGTLCQTLREYREDCFMRLRSRTDEGEKWTKYFSAGDAIPNEQGEEKKDEECEEETAEQPSEEEFGFEEPLLEEEEYIITGQEEEVNPFWACHVCTLENPEGVDKCEACETPRLPKKIEKVNKEYEFYIGKGFDREFYPEKDSLFSNDTEKQKVFKQLASFYLNNKKSEEARHSLPYSSHKFLEHWVINYMLNPPEKDTLKEHFVTLLTNLAANPLNEVRIFDIILTLYSIDPEDQALLKEFNTYFNIKLTKDEFKAKIRTFGENLMKILDKYLHNTVEKRNALQLENFDEVVAATEKLVGVLPFKNKVKVYTLVNAPKNVWSEICKKILESGVTKQSVVEEAVNLIAKSELKDLSPYDRTPQETSASVQGTVDSMIGLPKHSRVKKSLHTKILFCLESNEVFFNFLELLQKEYASNIESANSMLSEWVSQFKQIAKGELDKAEIEKILKNIYEDRDILKNQLLIQLLAKQSESIAASLKKAGDNFTAEQRTLCSTLKTMLAGLLDNQGFKSMYLYSIQVFELIEGIKKGSDEAIEDLFQLETLLDLIIDMYRVFRVHGALQEIGERMVYLASKHPSGQTITDPIEYVVEEEKKPSAPKFGRVATKGEDHLSTKAEDELGALPGLERSMTSIRESGVVKYDEMLMRMSQKARTLLQEIKLSKLPGSDFVLEIAVKREYERFVQFPWLLSFDKKLEIFNMLWNKERDRLYSYTLEFVVRRPYIVRDSKRQLEVFIGQRPSSRIANTEFKVSFYGEAGVDVGGLRNEWLSLVCKELFEPSLGLFQKSENETSIQPDPKSRVIPGYLSYFHFAGCIVGYVVANKLTIPANFTRSFLKLITDREVAIPDLADTDQQLMNSIEWMMKNPIQDVLDLDFTYETEFFGKRYTISLKDPGEPNEPVTDENKKDYVKRLIYHKLVKEIEGPINAFKQGFHRFVNPEYLKVFSIAELDKLIAGDPTIDFEDLKATVLYEGGYNAESEQIVWFWEIVKEYDQENLSALWFFATGLSRAVPGGFKNRPLTIQKTSDPEASLPKSHTCFAKIDLPVYSKKEDLAEKLLLAICEGKEGFGFT